MSISYNKKVIETVQEHIHSYFDSDEEFVNEVKRWGGCNFSAYHALYAMASQGVFLCYVDKQREFIMEAFGQTKEEAAKYSRDKVINMYKHLIARDGAKLFNKLENKYN